MRVAVNGWFFASLATGSGQYLSAFLDRLPNAGADHEYVLVQPALKQPDNAPAPPGWRTHALATPFDRIGDNLAKLWFEQVSFPLACQRLRADVAWTPYWGSSWWRPCPVVVTVHDLIPLLLPAYRGNWLQRGYTALVARTARRAAAVLTDSEASRRDIITHLRVPGERVHVVPLAACVAPSSAGLDDVRARYDLPEGRFLLYLGGFDVRKNLVRTLEAYARLAARVRAERGDVPTLVIAGRLPSRDSAFAPDPRPVVDRLRISEHVHFAGGIDERDKPALYQEALAVVFLSEYEGFGLPVLEAMAASGRPGVEAGPLQAGSTNDE